MKNGSDNSRGLSTTKTKRGIAAWSEIKKHNNQSIYGENWELAGQSALIEHIAWTFHHFVRLRFAIDFSLSLGVFIFALGAEMRNCAN